LKNSKKVVPLEKVMSTIISNIYGNSVSASLEKQSNDYKPRNVLRNTASQNASLIYKNENATNAKIVSERNDAEGKQKSVIDAVNSVMQELDDLKRQKSISKSPTLTNPLDDEGGEGSGEIQLEKRDFEMEYSNSIHNE
jgi:cell division septum initiation protein DivIVA